MTPLTRLQRRLALSAAAITSGVGLAMAAAAALERGGSLIDRTLIAAISCVLVLGAHLLPTLSRGALARLLWLGCVLLTAWNHASFFTAASLRAGSVRAEAVETRAQARALQADLDAIAARPLAAVSADLATAQARASAAAIALERCRAGAPHPAVPPAAAVAASAALPGGCLRLADAAEQARRRSEALGVEQGEARRAAELRQRLVDAAARQDQARDLAALDPVSRALAGLTGLSPDGLGTGVAVLSAMVVELMAALLWSVALLPQAGPPGPQAEDTSTAVASAADRPVPVAGEAAELAGVVSPGPAPASSLVSSPVRPPVPEPEPLPSPDPVLDWAALHDELRSDLLALAAPVAVRPRVEAALLRGTIAQLCDGRAIGLQVLAQLLNRDPDHLRRRTLAAMVHEGLLKVDYPSEQDPRPVYSAVAG